MFEDPATSRETNRREYGGLYYQMRWLDRHEAEKASALRAEILDRLAGRAGFLCEGSKPCLGELSPGCRLCAAGTWSCLFINNRCNASCFFCPARQEQDDTPSTSALTFPTPSDYADYCKELGIRGMSISGGEPLLALDRALSYLRECKKRFGRDCHFWMYTNGTLAGPDTFKMLADEGLDEIRFNITARDYRTDLVGAAARHIPVVTVEIPAVPEDSALLRNAMAEMASAGAKYLNLHQIRCTAYNCRNLIERDYSFLHGPHASVLESELAALEAMAFAAENKIPLSINYCSFIYRHRFQGDAGARRAALKEIGPMESVTPRGLIRRCLVRGGADRLARAEHILGAGTSNAGGWSRTPDGGAIVAVPALLANIPLEGISLHVEYERAFFSEEKSNGSSLMLDSGRELFIGRRRLFSAELPRDDVGRFLELCMGARDSISYTDDASTQHAAGRFPWNEILAYERMPRGLQDYAISAMDDAGT